ncbi:MAG: DUF559 domain-containing protein [Propionicimonas sp.]
MKEIINHLLDIGRGLVVRREHQAMRRSLDGYRDRGLLTALLPGVYCRPQDAQDLGLRVRAVALHHPDAVITGRAAARFTFWPELEVKTVEVARRWHTATAVGFIFRRRRIPPEWRLTSGGVTFTHPAVTVLDLCAELGGAVIDEALRRRSVSLAQLWSALTCFTRRRGNRLRRILLRESRDLPWSEMEREGHVWLRRARVKGWKANLKVVVEGEAFLLDIGFKNDKVGLELDGFAFHGSRLSFARDRRRDTLLTAAGWRIYRFTADDMADPVDFVRRVRNGLAEAKGRRRQRQPTTPHGLRRPESSVDEKPGGERQLGRRAIPKLFPQRYDPRVPLAERGG